MKVWAYNIETGVRGELLDEISLCTGYGSYGFELPEVRINKSGDSIQVAAWAETQSGRKIAAKDFGRDAVVFCIGEVTTGTDVYWEWVILVTPLKGETK
jgi:hypothetical protein